MTQGVKNNIHIHICIFICICNRIICLLRIIFIFVFVHLKIYLLHSVPQKYQFHRKYFRPVLSSFCPHPALSCSVLPCETFAKSSENQLHLACPSQLRYHRVPGLMSEMTESGGLVRLLASRGQHFSLSCLESCKVGKLPTVAIFLIKTSRSAKLCQDAK